MLQCRLTCRACQMRQARNKWHLHDLAYNKEYKMLTCIAKRVVVRGWVRRNGELFNGSRVPVSKDKKALWIHRTLTWIYAMVLNCTCTYQKRLSWWLSICVTQFLVPEFGAACIILVWVCLYSILDCLGLSPSSASDSGFLFMCTWGGCDVCFSSWVPAPFLGDPEWVPCSQLWPGPALTVVESLEWKFVCVSLSFKKQKKIFNSF